MPPLPIFFGSPGAPVPTARAAAVRTRSGAVTGASDGGMIAGGGATWEGGKVAARSHFKSVCSGLTDCSLRSE